MEKKEYKYYTRIISLPSGTPIGSHAIKFTLPTEMDTCEGVCATEYADPNHGANFEQFAIGLKDDTREFINPFHKDRWMNTSGKPADMFHDLGFQITSNEITCLVVNRSAFQSIVTIELLFKCSKISK